MVDGLLREHPGLLEASRVVLRVDGLLWRRSKLLWLVIAVWHSVGLVCALLLRHRALRFSTDELDAGGLDLCDVLCFSGLCGILAVRDGAVNIDHCPLLEVLQEPGVVLKPIDDVVPRCLLFEFSGLRTVSLACSDGEFAGRTVSACRGENFGILSEVADKNNLIY